MCANFFYVAPESFAEFLCGTWKRNLQWHGLGGTFPHQRSSSSVLHIGESATPGAALAEPGSTFLTWVFGEGRGEGELTMQCIPAAAVTTATVGAAGATGADVTAAGAAAVQGDARCFLHWTREGIAGQGLFKADLGVATLQFEGPGSQATVTYRVLDGDSAFRSHCACFCRICCRPILMPPPFIHRRPRICSPRRVRCAGRSARERHRADGQHVPTGGRKNDAGSCGRRGACGWRSERRGRTRQVTAATDAPCQKIPPVLDMGAQVSLPHDTPQS